MTITTRITLQIIIVILSLICAICYTVQEDVFYSVIWYLVTLVNLGILKQELE